MDLNNSFANRSFTAGDIYTGTPSNVTGLSNTIKVAYHGVNGVLRIYQSPNGRLWSYYEEFAISGNSFAQSGINGNYYYIQYTHGLGTSTITMATNVSQQIHNNFAVSLTAQDIVTVDGLLFDGDGALIVSSSGGGGGGDASAANQDLQITEAISTNTKLDTINTTLSGNLSVTESNPIDVSALATSAKQDTIIADLDAIVTSVGDSAINSTPIAYSPVHLDLETQGATAWADSTLPWFAPLNHEAGWQYDNSSAGGANLYFYGNTALVAGGIEPDFNLGSLMNMSFVGNYRLLLDNNPNKKFYLALTTKPQGAGDFYPGVFRSRKVWELPSSTVISKGADYLFYSGTDITSFRRDLDHKQMTLALSNGPCLESEICQFLSINVDSGTTVNQFSGIVKEAYFSNAGGTNRQVVFDNSISRKADLALSKLSVEMGVLAVSMGGFTFNGDNELLVTKQTYVDIRSSGIDLTHTTNASKECLDVQVNNITACDTGAVVISSGSVSVSGDVGLVAGTQVNLLDSVVGLVENTTIGIVGDVSVVSGATALSVTETAPLTGFALETTQADIKTQTDKLTFVDVDANTNNLKVIDLQNNAILSNLSFFTNEDTVTDLRVRVQNAIEVLNPEGGTLAISGNVGLVAESVIGVQNATGTSLDVHCYGSSDGATFHHLKTTATGELVTHSQTRDGSGTAITSTPNGGITALDVAVSGTATISGVVDSRAQEAFMPSVITSTNVTGPVQIGTVVDTQHYLWISAILQFSSITAGGNIYLEVSPDSSMWARPSGAQVFINTSITTTTAAILLSSPVSMRYVRLWADTGFVGVSGTAYICCK